MGDKQKDNFWTVEKIAEAFQKGSYKIEGCGEEFRNKKTSVYIKNKIKEILKEIDCPESIFRRSAQKMDGHFLFKDDDNVPDRIYRIFEFYDMNHDKICESFMSDEEKTLMGMLYEIRPIFRKKPSNNTYMESRRELKEFYTKKYARIYIKKFFVKVDVKDGRPDKCVRGYIYIYQGLLISAWYEKWSYLMDSAMRLRINERILNGYQCDLENIFPDEKKRKRFYLEGRWYDELKEGYLKQDRLSEEEVYNACYNLYYFNTGGLIKKPGTQRKNSHVLAGCRKKCVSYVTEIFSHSLLGVSIEDYLYMLHKAIGELGDIHTELEYILNEEIEYDELVYRLKQVQKTVREDGLKGKKNKELERILDELFPVDNEKSDRLQMSAVCTEGPIPICRWSFEIDDLSPEVKALVEAEDWRYMTKEIDNIKKGIREIIEKGGDDSVIKKGIIGFCDKKMKEYYGCMEFRVNRKLSYGEYKKYYLKEMEETKIDKDIDFSWQRIDWCRVFAGVRQQHINAEKNTMFMVDFLPADEREKFWSIREVTTGRELI